MYGEEIILCRVKNVDWFFLPGGHVRDGESTRAALLRELSEEMGNSDYKVASFVGVCENIFPLEENVLQHEVNIIFKVDVPSKLKIDVKEDHIEFVNVNKNDLKDYKILPPALKVGLLGWLKDERPFFKEI